MTKKTIEKQIEELTAIANKLSMIAPPTVPITPVSISNSGDHDLLTKLDTKLGILQTTVDKLVERDNNYIAREEWKTHLSADADHETRIKILEIGFTKLMAYGTALIFAVGIAEFFISKLLK